jgi:CubicO group peptidase (beta-lactamase class C family)
MSMLDEVLLRRIFDDAVERSGAYGAQLSIIKGAQQIDCAAGFANAQRGLVMTPDTLMQIGSVTKIFNAMIVISLAQEGAVDLDTPIVDYLQTFEVANSRASLSLTLRHLLSMCSGLDNGPYTYFGERANALGAYVSHLKSLPQRFPSGQGFGYSNAGTCIAGCVASQVMGRSWEALLQERILVPAGLNQSAALDADVRHQAISSGHFPTLGGNTEIVDPMLSARRARAPSGASLALSTSNLARFGGIFVNNGVADTGARIVSEHSIEELMRPQTEVPTQKYGTAWCIGPYTGNWNGVQVWGHGGTSPTSTSFLHWIPEQKGVIAFVVNTHLAMGDFAKTMFDEIMKVAFGFSKPRFDVRDEPMTADYRRYIGLYDELGMAMDVVRGDGDTLIARLIPKSPEYQMGVGPEQSVVLTPLGGDRFLINPPDGPSKHRGVVDMAFFGSDGEGRATNALNLLFPMSRVDT